MRKGSHHTEEAKRKLIEEWKLKIGNKNNHWKGGKIKKKCQICGKEFIIKPSQIKYGQGRFCSQRCQGIWQSKDRIGKNSSGWKGGKTKRICQQCKKEFTVNPAIVKMGWGKFCSYQCKSIWQSQNMKGENCPNWKGGKIKRHCIICDKDFEIDVSQIKYGRGKFCSRKCLGIWSIKHSKKKDTDIERLIENELIRRDIPYTKQVPLLGITLVDFLLPHDTVIYCDGDYWHSKSKTIIRDTNQGFMLTFYGYKVFRFLGKDIKKSAKNCINKIIKKEG